MIRKLTYITDWLIRGKDGRIYLTQMPNIPIVGWAILAVIASFTAAGSIKTGLLNLSLAFLAIWSYLEITEGASRVRRILGVTVAILIIRSFFS